MAQSFRALFRWLLPGNYHTEGSDGEKVLWSLAQQLDLIDELNRERLTARFPSYADESALALIGADRGLIRGRAETAEAYAARLIGWRYPYGHRVRGSGYALLEQIWTYFGGGFELHTVQQNYLLLRRGADGTESADEAYGWDWDSQSEEDWSEKWAKAWVVIDGSALISETPDLGDPLLYGGQHGDSSYAFGHGGVSADDVNAIRRLLRGRAWKPAGTRCMWAIVSFDGSEPIPEGLWGTWGKDNGSGTWVATRSPSFRYWALDPTARQYAGDPESYPLAAIDVTAGAFVGDATVWDGTSTMPGGFSVAGNPALFPASANLIDDGSIP